MNKTIIYRRLFDRDNSIKAKARTIFSGLAAYPMSLPEAFLRKNMGERYFNFFYNKVMAFLLLVTPFLLPVSQMRPWYDTVLANWSMYALAIPFIYLSYQRYKETWRREGQFNLNRFSRSSGEILPFFFKLKHQGKPVNERTIEKQLEPAAIFFAGLLLLLIGQTLTGGILIFCAFSYWQSYSIAYALGDEYILDTIDRLIVNREFARMFIYDEPSTSGLKLRFSDKPDLKEMREMLYREMGKDDKDAQNGNDGNSDDDDDENAVVQ